MQSSQGAPHFTAFGLIWPRPRLTDHDSTWTDMAYYPIGVGQTVSIPVVNDGAERGQTMLRANISAQTAHQRTAGRTAYYQRNPEPTDATHAMLAGKDAMPADRGGQRYSKGFFGKELRSAILAPNTY